MSSRMTAEDRRDQVLDGATHAFARGGYHGTSTDAVARRAGVSQPYVVRLFGTKLELFLEVFERSVQRVIQAFAAVIDRAEFDAEDEEAWQRLSLAYYDLIGDRDSLQVMMHGFSAGSVAEIAAAARRTMGQVFTTIKRTGCTDDQARDFIAYGMLINVMLAMRAPEHRDEGGATNDLVLCTLGEIPGQPRLPGTPQ